MSVSNVDPAELGRAAAERLIGTTLSIANLATEFPGIEDLETDGAFCAALDQEIFRCQICDWWCGQSEMSDDHDWVCEDCANSG